MKTVSVSKAESHLGELIDEVLNGEPVVVGRGKRRVILKPFESADVTAEEDEFHAAFPPAPREPRDAADRISHVIRRVRRAA
ncbi:MAG: type II toxin-antitoxin system Phd/YefM family antitoxin [Verrucomicrobia bacterium]|nr:type II toxin-antitoxin system Phd/YefM family antitoxin [Verrucomicrobiota bacterium]